MSGVNGRLFAPLAVAFLLATLASLILAVTLTPALCYWLLPRLELTEPQYIGWLKRQHSRCLEFTMRHSRWTIGATAAVCIAAVAVLPIMGGDFLPDFKEGHYIVRMTMAPGAGQ